MLFVKQLRSISLLLFVRLLLIGIKLNYAKNQRSKNSERP